jgi:hypothetical protein
MFGNALGQGVEMAQRRISWASSSCKASVSLESILGVCILNEAFAPAKLTRGCHRLLREEEGSIVGKKPGDPEFV